MDGKCQDSSRRQGVLRDRRDAIRYPFAADAEILDLGIGLRGSGVTSDISRGGCFVCTRRPLSYGARVHLTLSWKGEKVEAVCVIRVVKQRVGMGLEFLDMRVNSREIFLGWIERLRTFRG